jgi:hypothetical protein
MHAIDSFGSVAGAWYNGDPGHIPPVPPTMFTQDWFNDMQGNLLALLLTAGIAPIKLDLTQLTLAVQAQAFGGGGKGCANLLDNSDFWLWQRLPGAAATVTSAKYTADRWLSFGGGGSGSASVIRFGLDLADIPEERAILDANSAGGTPGAGAQVMNWQQSVAATTTKPSFEQRQTEILWTTQGKKVTVSFWARLHSGSTPVDVDVEIEQNFGTGGSPSSPVIVTTTPATITTSWTRFSKTFTLGAINGKTRGTSSPYLSMRVKMPLSATYNLEFGWFDMKALGTISNYVHPGMRNDWIECSRYYWKTQERNVAVDTTSVVGSVSSQETGTECAALNTRFPCEMRAVPTIVWHAPSTGATAKIDRAGTAVTVTGTVGTSTKTTGYPQTGSGSDTLNQAHIEADAEL